MSLCRKGRRPSHRLSPRRHTPRQHACFGAPLLPGVIDSACCAMSPQSSLSAQATTPTRTYVCRAHRHFRFATSSPGPPRPRHHKASRHARLAGGSPRPPYHVTPVFRSRRNAVRPPVVRRHRQQNVLIARSARPLAQSLVGRSCNMTAARLPRPHRRPPATSLALATIMSRQARRGMFCWRRRHGGALPFHAVLPIPKIAAPEKMPPADGAAGLLGSCRHTIGLPEDNRFAGTHGLSDRRPFARPPRSAPPPSPPPSLKIPRHVSSIR